MKLPILALTAYAMSEDRAKCMKSGCTDYMTKPVDEELLLRAVGRYLGDYRSCDAMDYPQAAIAASPPSTPADDEIGLIRSRQADNPRIMKIIPEFVAGLHGDVRKMTDLLERNDLSALRKVVHQLRGSGGGYGFDVISKAAGTAEESIKADKAISQIAGEIELLIGLIRRIEGYDQSKETLADEAANK
jgi:HPt (histidine-containing phosphotransfer) domain-containing protein